MEAGAPRPGGGADVRVVACSRGLLADLQAVLPSPYHEGRYVAQLTGLGVYLVALAGGRAAGHGLLRWCTTDPNLRGWGLLDPYIESLGVVPALQSRGIGTALVRAAEQEAWSIGHRRAGLSVGIKNTRARSLYERLGFEFAGWPPFEVRWAYTDASGGRRWESETCVYLAKGLTDPS